MLTSLIIKNFALIDSLEIEFDSGLNVISGETGAGKSIIIGALQLILGQRAEKSMIRNEAEYCEIGAIFEFSPNPTLLEQINETLAGAGVSCCTDGQLIISRVIKPKSARNFINSSPVSLNFLNKLGNTLVDVHGPYDHQSLLKSRHQMDLLDAYGGLNRDVIEQRQLYEDYQSVVKELKKCNEEVLTPERIEILRYQVNEIRQANILENEDKKLNERHTVVANGKQILELLNNCLGRINDDNAVGDQLTQIMRDLTLIASMDNNKGSEFIQTLEGIIADVEALNDSILDYVDTVDLDSDEFAELENRLALLQKLKSKYGGSIAEIIRYADDAEIRLAKLENLETYQNEIRKQVEKAEKKMLESAGKLSRNRRAVTAKLSSAISNKLQSLGFDHCQFSIEISESVISPTGIDSVEFRFAPNPGEGSKSLREIASSGEISRVMLAIKTILAKVDRVPVLVFDEVDVNIGGKVAATVGHELRALGQDHQVLCITHLPQVAANADRHFAVHKTTSGKRTVAAVTELSESGRIEEIARMLGGNEATSVVLKHALELIDKAKQL